MKSEMTEAEITEIDVTPEMVRVARLIEDLYAIPGCSLGGPLHITTDDNNVTDGNLDFCRKELLSISKYTDLDDAVEAIHVGTQILDALQPMSEIERSLTCQIHHGDRYVPPNQTRTFSYPTRIYISGEGDEAQIHVEGDRF